MTISKETRARIREQARDRCGYCLSQQRFTYGPLEIEHIVPEAASGTDDEENLWLGCRMCNNYKGTQTSGVDPESGENSVLFNPRKQVWNDHFRWSEDGTTVIGQTPCGRATVSALQMNNRLAVLVRVSWVQAGWHPPED
jgi:hypothetical protein